MKKLLLTTAMMLTLPLTAWALDTEERYPPGTIIGISVEDPRIIIVANSEGIPSEGDYISNVLSALPLAF